MKGRVDSLGSSAVVVVVVSWRTSGGASVVWVVEVVVIDVWLICGCSVVDVEDEDDEDVLDDEELVEDEDVLDDEVDEDVLEELEELEDEELLEELDDELLDEVVVADVGREQRITWLHPPPPCPVAA